MQGGEGTERITGLDVLARHLDALVAHDPRLLPVRAAAGEVPLRRGTPGFEGLVHIIVGQLLSVKVAAVIHRRLTGFLGEISAAKFLTFSQNDICALGLTRAKFRAMRAVAEAEQAGQLDYAALASLPEAEAVAALVAFPGIGRWTAEIYLLSAIGHGDIFPAGDLALRKAVGYALGTDLPDETATRRIAENWSPWRGAAARLLWRYYAVRTQREGIGL